MERRSGGPLRRVMVSGAYSPCYRHRVAEDALAGCSEGFRAIAAGCVGVHAGEWLGAAWPEQHPRVVIERESESVEVVDARTLRVRYREPYAPALESWMMGIIPKHLLAGTDLNTSPLLRRPVGTPNCSQWRV